MKLGDTVYVKGKLVEQRLTSGGNPGEKPELYYGVEVHVRKPAPTHETMIVQASEVVIIQEKKEVK